MQKLAMSEMCAVLKFTPSTLWLSLSTISHVWKISLQHSGCLGVKITGRSNFWTNRIVYKALKDRNSSVMCAVGQSNSTQQYCLLDTLLCLTRQDKIILNVACAHTQTCISFEVCILYLGEHEDHAGWLSAGSLAVDLTNLVQVSNSLSLGGAGCGSLPWFYLASGADKKCLSGKICLEEKN